MLRILLAVAFLVGAMFAFDDAFADDVLSWKHPTQYTDLSALDPADIDRTVIRWFNQTDPTLILGSVDVIAPAITTTVARDTTVPGTICYQAATVMKATAGGTQSGFGPTDGVCKTIVVPTKKPKKPTNITVQ